jgi:hypothetical protein
VAKAQTSNSTDEKLSQTNAKDHEASEGETLPQAVEAMKLWYRTFGEGRQSRVRI